MIRVQEIATEMYEAWDRFVASHPAGGAFHLSAMVRMQRQLPYLHPIALAALDEGGEVVGGTVGVVSVEKPGVLSLLSTRAITSSGPLLAPHVDRREALPALQLEFDRRAKGQHALFSEVWLTHPPDDTAGWAALGYDWIPHLNYLIDLDAGENALWEQFSASRRKNIRRASHMGVTVQSATTWDQYAAMHGIVERSYRELGLPMYPISFFRAIFENLVPLGLARGYVALLGGEILAGRIVLCHNEHLHDWYAGSATEMRRFYPDEVLVWEILRQHVAEGYRLFDFGGAGHPDVEYGPREFKRRFGGKLVNYGRLRKPYAPTRLWLVEHGFEGYRYVAGLCARAFGRQRRTGHAEP